MLAAGEGMGTSCMDSDGGWFFPKEQTQKQREGIVRNS